jgi:Trk K+ transport system NAD-binding subunit
MVSRGGRLVQVRGDTQLRAGDEVLALAEEGDHPDHLFETAPRQGPPGA